jgi:hypothetical protein
MTNTKATTQPSAGIGPPDMDVVRRLVAEVVQRLRAEGVANGPALVTQPAALMPRMTTADSQPAHESAPRAGSRYGAPESAAAGYVVTDTVVTLAVIEQVPAGAHRVIVPARAVITPSAREHAADSGLEIVRAGPHAAAAAVSRPFLIAHADCAAEVKVKTAAIARAVTGSQHLPASGLADVIAALALHVGRDGARGVLLSGRPALAVAAANRHRSLRAVTGHDVLRVKAAAGECAANLLVLDPAAFSSTALERLCSELAHGPDLAAPAELTDAAAAPPAPCACHGKHH